LMGTAGLRGIFSILDSKPPVAERAGRLSIRSHGNADMPSALGVRVLAAANMSIMVSQSLVVGRSVNRNLTGK